MELPNIAAYAYQDVHVWSALLSCLRPPALVRMLQTHHRALGTYTLQGLWIDTRDIHTAIVNKPLC